MRLFALALASCWAGAPIIVEHVRVDTVHVRERIPCLTFRPPPPPQVVYGGNFDGVPNFHGQLIDCEGWAMTPDECRDIANTYWAEYAVALDEWVRDYAWPTCNAGEVP